MRIPKGYKEEERAWIEDMEKTRKRLEELRDSYETPLDPLPPPKPETQESLMKKMMQRMLDGPPPSIRVIAQFGYSKYDFTVTKTSELQLLHLIIDRFRNSFDSTY